MITADQLCKIIVEQELPYIRITDLRGKCLYSIEDTDDAKNTANQLKDVLSYFTNYGTLRIKAANPTEFRGKYVGANEYDVKVSENTPAKVGAIPLVQNDPFHQMESMLRVVTLFNGMMGGNNNNNSRIEELKLQFELEREKRVWEKDNEDPIKKYAAGLPIILSAMGKKPEEITATLQQMAATHTMFNPAAPAPPGTRMAGVNVLETDAPLSIEAANLIPNEEKNKMIQKLFDSLPEKFGAEEILILLQAIKAQPELAPNYVRLLELSKKVSIEKITRLLNGLIEKPEYAETALTFFPIK